MKRILFIIVATVALGGGILFLLIYDPRQGDTLEHGRRLMCETKQKGIYSALIKYRQEYARAPSDLEILVQEGYLREKDIYCSTPADEMNTRLYKYFPTNFGEPNLPVISENVENHSGKGARLKNLRPAIIETMGDGTIVTKNIGSNN
jgi:hypothetical protein